MISYMREDIFSEPVIFWSKKLFQPDSRGLLVPDLKSGKKWKDRMCMAIANRRVPMKFYLKR